MLLDADLNAFLADTGFAKAARRSGDASTRGGATTGRICGTPGYAEASVMAGNYSEATDGFAAADNFGDFGPILEICKY